jgi:hypothetical protein
MPAGRFSRSLSNSGEELLLADGLGNEIDRVDYSDQPPWPDARFNGYYLKLSDQEADNNIGSNWIASTSSITGVDDTDPFSGIKLYPTPVRDQLTIESGTTILSVDLYDLTGRILLSMPVNSSCEVIDMSGRPGGVYLVRITTPSASYLRKVIRE